MNAIAEIDKAGRIVVPKKMRDALHLVAGTRLTLKQDGERIVLEPAHRPSSMVLEGAILVHRVEGPPTMPLRNWVQEDREARMQAVLGNWTKL